MRREHDVFRGQVLMFGESGRHGDQPVTFLSRPDVTAEQVILPAGVLEIVERHIVGIGGQSEALRRALQHLKRGLLLHGPPGTGKTHTVRYLMGRLRDTTIIVLAGRAMRRIEQAAALARRLQPAMIVLEDVDLITEDREFSPEPTGPLLFMLLDAMDGIGTDADVTFVLTTNRAGVLERALADRPGRVDLAVQIPRPDAAARERLLRLYAGPVELPGDLGPVVAATEGVTASFIKEFMRRTVLAAFRTTAEVTRLGTADFDAALAEITSERETLTRSLLGRAAEPPEAPLAPIESRPHWG